MSYGKDFENSRELTFVTEKSHREFEKIFVNLFPNKGYFRTLSKDGIETKHGTHVINVVLSDEEEAMFRLAL